MKIQANADPIPRTRAMSVIELARRAGVPAHVVRYYTRRGLLQPRRSLGNNYRMYGGQDLERLRLVRHARTLGVGLREVESLLAAVDAGEPPAPLLVEAMHRRLRCIEAEIRERQEARVLVRKALDRARRLPAPDGGLADTRAWVAALVAEGEARSP